MGGKSYGTRELFVMLRKYILDLGRIPSQSEVRNNPDLPSDETFLSIYPTWEKVIAVAGFRLNWCDERMKKKLIIDLRRKYVELGFRLPNALDIQTDPNMEKTFVYLQVFGDLDCARMVAGIWRDFCYRQRLNIVQTIRVRAKELGRVPKLRDEGMPNEKMVKKVFGSYASALKAAGFQPTYQLYDRKQLAKQLQAKFQELGRVPSAQELRDDPKTASIQTYRKHFGSYTAALRAAKIPIGAKRVGGAYTEKELIQQMQRKYRELGRAPRMQDVNDDPNMASANVFARCFGNYKKALQVAGISTRRIYAKYSRDDLIAQLQEKAAVLGRAPKQKEVDGDPNMVSVNTLAGEFGSFSAALSAAGLTVSERKIYDDKELLDKLQAKYIEVGFLETGKTPTNNEINADPEMPSTSAYNWHFGGVRPARELVERRLNALRDDDSVKK